MSNRSFRTAAATAAGFAVVAAGVSAGPAEATTSAPARPKPTVTCSTWQAVGDSSVSARTCVAVRAGHHASHARGKVQLKNDGTTTAKVSARWTLSVVKHHTTVVVRTVTVRRAVPANGHTYTLGGHGRFFRLDAAGLAAVQARIVVKAPKTGTDVKMERTHAHL